MHAFPIELWQHVFRIAHSTTARHSSCDSRNPLEIEIILSSICRYWQHIALNTAGLWTISTILPTTSSTQLLQLYISRSASLSISMRIDLGVEGLDFSTSICNQYHHFSMRLSQLYLECGSPRHPIKVLSRMAGFSHPVLEVIVLRSHGWILDFQEPITFHNTPRLAEAYMDSVFFNALSHHTLRSMKHILVCRHRISSEGEIYQSFLQIFDGSLLECLEIGSNYTEFCRSTTCTTLPNLKTLVIPQISLNILFHCFEAIRAPILQTVAISTSLNTQPQPWHPPYCALPVDPLYTCYAALSLQANIQLPESFQNVFASVQNFGLIGAAMETSPQILAITLRRLALIFPNVISLHMDISIGSLRLNCITSSPLVWPDLHYLYSLWSASSSPNISHALALQESCVHVGYPLHSIYLAKDSSPCRLRCSCTAQAIKADTILIARPLENTKLLKLHYRPQDLTPDWWE